MYKKTLQNKIKKYTSKYNNLYRMMTGGHKFKIGNNVINKVTNKKGIIVGLKHPDKYMVAYKGIPDDSILSDFEDNLQLDIFAIIQPTNSFDVGNLIIDTSKNLFGKIIEIISENKYKIFNFNNNVSEVNKSNLLSFDDYLHQFYELPEDYIIDYQSIRNKIHDYKYHLFDTVTDQEKNKNGIITNIKIELFEETSYRIKYNFDESSKGYVSENNIVPYNLKNLELKLSPYNNEKKILPSTHEKNISPIINTDLVKRSKDIKYNLFDIIYDSRSKKTGIIISIDVVRVEIDYPIIYGILFDPNNDLNLVSDYTDGGKFLTVEQKDATFVHELNLPSFFTSIINPIQKIRKYKKGDIVFNIKKNKKCKIIGLAETDKYILECDSGNISVCFESDIKDLSNNTHKEPNLKLVLEPSKNVFFRSSKINVGDIVFDILEGYRVKVVSQKDPNTYMVIPLDTLHGAKLYALDINDILD